jgi:hypothetical protein
MGGGLDSLEECLTTPEQTINKSLVGPESLPRSPVFCDLNNFKQGYSLRYF